VSASGDDESGAPPEPGAQARREARMREEAQLTLTLWRHGEPDWFPDGRSVDDAALTARGRAQARAAAKSLASERVDAIYVSPLRRAQETARSLVEATGMDAVTIDDLAEIGIDTPGASQAEVDAFFLQAMRRPLPEHWSGWPRGEGFRDFHARVRRGIEGVLARHHVVPAKRGEFTVWSLPPRPLSVVIVAHGGTNAVLLAHLLDLAPVPWEWMRFESELAAYSVLKARPLGVDGAVWSLVNFNEVDPLRAARLR
jgi:broad specificity phosphatase PhoE